MLAQIRNISQYGKTAHFNTTHLRRQNFYALPQAHWQLLAAPPFNYLDTLIAVDDAIDKNDEIARAIFEVNLQELGIPESPPHLPEGRKHPQDIRGYATSSDFDKARSTLRQLYRDWSAEGAQERAKCYDPVIADLLEESEHQGKKLKILVPGAGLGRLCFELCRRGFLIEGNEISYHQLLASSYILNHCKAAHEHVLFPWVQGFSNHRTREDHLKAVRIPDIAAVDAMLEPSWGEMSMSASDFLLLYSDAEHESMYDAVATMFFIDTAPNFIRYIETIRHCLTSGGIWTNFGPLLWHFENNAPGSHGQGSRSDESMHMDEMDEMGKSHPDIITEHIC